MPSPSQREVVNLSLVNVGPMTAFDKLLSDIPALSVGLLGFAALTFFMILKKVKLAPFLLLSSALFTFFAAIVDLAQISLQHNNSGRARIDNGQVTTLVTIREALSSIASGLRFLYFWAFVAQPPLCEQGSGSFLRLHSGSWLHWGLTGTVLRWTTLLASLSIFVLQALWRMAKPLRRFGPVYDVESALEITASAIFIVKLILNSTIVEAPCRRETLWQYSTAFFSLVINLGVAIGNHLDFTFSETALGRLLLATALYIPIVSSMVFSFYTREPTTPLPSWRDKRASSFRGLHVSFYDAGQGLVGENINPTGSSQHTSSWLSWNAPQRQSSQFRPSYESGMRSKSEEGVKRDVSSPPSDTSVPSIPNGIAPSSVNSSFTDPITRGFSEGFSSSIARLPTGSDNGKSSTPARAAMTMSPDSPTLPPSGIREARERHRLSQKPKQLSDGSIASSQLSGFETLLREQNELEKSIAALRTMFAPERSRKGEIPDATSNIPGQSMLRESSTTAYGPTSSSNRSDFSLSVFPEVPPVTENFSRTGLRSPSTSALTPTQISFNVGEQVFPVSTAEGDDVAILAFGQRTESAGTRYDVTSFIGDLTSPDQGDSVAQIAMYLRDSYTDSEPGSADLATIVTVERKSSNAVISRPKLVEKASLVPEVPTSASGSTSAPSHGHSIRDAAAETPARQRSPRRVVGLPPRPKRGDSPLGDQQMGSPYQKP